MSIAETRTSSPPPADGMLAAMFSRERMDRFVRAPSMSVPLPGRRPMKLATDRVRARPAVSPNISMMLGMGAIGLGVWGTLAPRSVSRFLGLKAHPAAVQSLFGARELATGYTLAGDPTRADMLWARVGGDIFDIAVLKAADNPSNPKAGNVRGAMGFVLAVTALDLLTAWRMSTVQRSCR